MKKLPLKLKIFGPLKENSNSCLIQEEIDSLLAAAEEVSKDKGVANNGQGITVVLAEAGDIYEYQVVRIYK